MGVDSLIVIDLSVFVGFLVDSSLICVKYFDLLNSWYLTNLGCEKLDVCETILVYRVTCLWVQLSLVLFLVFFVLFLHLDLDLLFT